jgi:ribokinase
MNRTPILCFGSLNIDDVFRVDHLVRPGETISSHSYQTFAGGKGFNQSIALARAGARISHAGQIGEDGLWLREMLAESGADVAHVRVSETPSGHAIIQVDAAGENAIILYGGANQAIEPEWMDRVLADFGEEGYLLVQNEISQMPHLLRRAGEMGLDIVFNPAPMTPAVMDYPLKWVRIFVVNETEGAALTGEVEAEAILARMGVSFPQAATVLTLGSQGAIYAAPQGKGGERITVPAYPVQPVDTTAAGDTFTGYFLACLAQGWDVEASLHQAAKAAALCVTRAGAAPSIPTAAEVAGFGGG